jgi:hypothetical protein
MKETKDKTADRAVIAQFRNGESKEVEIRELGVGAFSDLLKSQANEVELIKLYTGLDSDKIEALRPESQVDILEAGERLNGDFFCRCFARTTQRLKLINPEAAAKFFAPNL